MIQGEPIVMSSEQLKSMSDSNQYHEEYVDSEPFIFAQEKLDTACANIHEWKSHAITKLMNQTIDNSEEEYVGDDGEPWPSREEDMFRRGHHWQNWFAISRFGKTKYMDQGKAISHQVTVSNRVTDEDNFTDMRTQLVEITLVFIKKNLKQMRMNGIDDFVSAITESITEVNARANHTWERSNESDATFMHTDSGLTFEFERMTSRPFVADHRYEQYHSCRKMTQEFNIRPLSLKITMKGSETNILTLIYPRREGIDNMALGGLLVGASLVNDVAGIQQLYPTVIQTKNLALTRDVHNGIFEEDAASLLASHARKYRDDLMNMFVATHCMRAVLGKDQSDIPPLRTLSAEMIKSIHLKYQLLNNQDKRAKELMSSLQRINESNSPHFKDRRVFDVTCTGGTVDCFNNDTQHTDMSLHTNNNVFLEFTYEDKKTLVDEPIAVSMYATYYIGGLREMNNGQHSH